MSNTTAELAYLYVAANERGNKLAQELENLKGELEAVRAALEKTRKEADGG